MAGQARDNGTINVKIMVPLKYLSNFWRTLEMSLINCEINPILTWSTNCVIVSTNVANQNVTFEITETKLYVLVVTLSTKDNSKLLQQLKSGFKRILRLSSNMIGNLDDETNFPHKLLLTNRQVANLFITSISFRTRYANLGHFLPNFRNNDVRTRIKISKLVKPVLGSQYICVKVSINSYFDAFITMCM